MKIINQTILVLLFYSFFGQNVLATSNADSELGKAEKIVQQFLSYSGNVEDFENYWLGTKRVRLEFLKINGIKEKFPHYKYTHVKISVHTVEF